MSGFGILMAGGSGLAPLSISISPGDLYAARTGAGGLTSSADTATGLGGNSPYTYAWAYISGNSFTINTPSSQSTTFTTSLSSGLTKIGVYRCTVTDNVGATAYADVTVILESL